MAVTLIATTTGNGASNFATTGTVDTTGATLIVISVSWWGGGGPTVSFSDSKSNTWTPLTLQASGGANNMRQQFAYCFNPTVGTGHTFTVNGVSTYPAMVVHAFSGTAGYSYQTRSGAGSGSTASPFATGSVTPVGPGAVVLTGYVVNNSLLPTGLTVSTSGFTVTKRDGVSGTNFPGAAAYYLQPSVAAVNPTWAWSSGSFETAVSTAVFSGPAVAAERVEPVLILPV